MGQYDYFFDRDNFYDLDLDKDYEALIKILSSSNQNKTIVPVEEKKIVKTLDEIIKKYNLHSFKEKLENFDFLSPLEQGELLYDIKNLIKENFVSFYKEFGIDKSKVSIRTKLYELSLEFVEYRDVIQNLKIGVIGCMPKDNLHLKELILKKIRSGELKQDRNKIKHFINQIQFTDKEQELNTKLLKLRSCLDKKIYKKLSEKDQERILNHFNKIDKIIEKEGYQ